jgi:hypothetical protein
MASTVANKLKYLLATGAINFSSDSFKIVLMQSGYTFDPDAHHDYADVSASELATDHGYTADTKTLSGVAVTEDDSNDRTAVTWDPVTWTASGGDIGPTPGAIIYDDTEASNSIVGYIDFGGDQTQADGGVATITGIELRIA